MTDTFLWDRCGIVWGSLGNMWGDPCLVFAPPRTASCSDLSHLQPSPHVSRHVFSPGSPAAHSPDDAHHARKIVETHKCGRARRGEAREKLQHAREGARASSLLDPWRSQDCGDTQMQQDETRRGERGIHARENQLWGSPCLIFALPGAR